MTSFPASTSRLPRGPRLNRYNHPNHQPLFLCTTGSREGGTQAFPKRQKITQHQRDSSSTNNNGSSKHSTQHTQKKAHLLPAVVVPQHAVRQHQRRAGRHGERAPFPLRVVLDGLSGSAVVHGAAVKLHVGRVPPAPDHHGTALARKQRFVKGGYRSVAGAVREVVFTSRHRGTYVQPLCTLYTSTRKKTQQVKQHLAGVLSLCT